MSPSFDSLKAQSIEFQRIADAYLTPWRGRKVRIKWGRYKGRLAVVEEAFWDFHGHHVYFKVVVLGLKDGKPLTNDQAISWRGEEGYEWIP